MRTTDSFTDAQGRYYIAGVEVPPVVWERFLFHDARLQRCQAALETIEGPSDDGAYIEKYRHAGGGYEGLQAIARAALREDRAVSEHGVVK
jgi:hypothetical protein